MIISYIQKLTDFDKVEWDVVVVGGGGGGGGCCAVGGGAVKNPSKKLIDVNCKLYIAEIHLKFAVLQNKTGCVLLLQDGLGVNWIFCWTEFDICDARKTATV